MAVYALLSKLNTSKSTNTEDFPTWVCKNNAHLITQPMTDIINTGFWKTRNDGIFRGMFRGTFFKNFRNGPNGLNIPMYES